MNVSESGRGGRWLVLPDTAAPALELPVIARHPSGRPWLLGDSTAVLVASAGPISVAAFGELLLDGPELTRAVRRAVEHDDYDPLMTYPGNYGLVVREPRRMLLYSDVSGLRRAHMVRYGRLTLAGSHARLLADLSRADLDPVWVAARLCSPMVPTNVRDTRSPYEGVTPVPAGSRALLVYGKAPKVARYWKPPEPVLDRAEGATRLRVALETAVGERARRAHGTVTVQLSGGLDSSVLAALATSAVGRERVVLATIPSIASGDVRWARLIAEHLGAHHELLIDAPSLFSGLPDIAPKTTDEPPPSAAGTARTAHMAHSLVVAGSGLHLNGQGGDEVLGASLAYLGSELRDLRPQAIRYLRGHAALRGWSTLALARHALNKDPYRRWVRHTADTLAHRADVLRDAVSWETHPRLVPWASTYANDLVGQALADASKTTLPLGARPLHATITRIRASAYAAGSYGQTMSTFGVTPTFPFFDRAVIEACLSAHPWARSDPWEFKPLLCVAMGDLLPMSLLNRTTKGSYTPDVHAGWTRHRSEVLRLLSEPLLGEMGLVDPERVRRSLTGWGASGTPPGYVTDLIALELWTRTAQTPYREKNL